MKEMFRILIFHTQLKIMLASVSKHILYMKKEEAVMMNAFVSFD